MKFTDAVLPFFSGVSLERLRPQIEVLERALANGAWERKGEARSLLAARMLKVGSAQACHFPLPIFLALLSSLVRRHVLCRDDDYATSRHFVSALRGRCVCRRSSLVDESYCLIKKGETLFPVLSLNLNVDSV